MQIEAMSLKVVLQSVALIVLLITCCHASGERARYDNYRVYKLLPSNELGLSALKQLDGASDSIIFLDGIHFVGKDVSAVVAPHKVPDFLEIMHKNGVQHELVDRNLQASLESDVISTISRATTYDWSTYHTLEETYEWLNSLTSTYAGIVTLIEGGTTYQGRSILGVKISYPSSKAQKPGIFLEAGIHAREWIAPATATYIINQLLTSNDSAIQNIAQNYDWYIFPNVNPDGYVYTHTTDRLWRKTRTPYGSCFGADPNRNWGVHWNEVGASSNACSDTYAGPHAFSEIETRSLADYIASLKGKIQLYISFHAYSQLLLYPYGYSGKLPSNVKDLKQVFDVAIAGMSKRYGTKYTGGNIYDAIYPAAGSSVDWTYDNVNVKMSFCYELRPSSKAFFTGFKLPATQIVPTGQETVDSLIAMINKVNELGYFI